MEDPKEKQVLAPPEELETESETQEYNDIVVDRDPRDVAQIMSAFNADGTARKIVKARKSTFVHNLIHLNGEKFDFAGRDYLRPIYDGKDRNILLKTGRQVEKCVRLGKSVILADGRHVAVETLIPGDVVVSFESNGRQGLSRVVASESNGDRPCLRIRTRLGSELEVTLNHPLRKLSGWVKAEGLKPGDKIASLRSVGQFGTQSVSFAGLIGLLFGDGCFSSDGSKRQKTIGFTCKNKEVQTWFERLAIQSGHERPAFHVSTAGSRQYRLRIRTRIGEWLLNNGLFGSVAQNKTLPDEVFQYDQLSARELLRGLWATDGHCKNVTPSKVDLVYCSTSKQLIHQVRLLLRKFGVVTTLREYQPKKGKLAYILRVVTRKSIEAFYREIGPIPGKPFELPKGVSNSNLDTLPKEIIEWVNDARKSSGNFWKRSGFQSKDLRVRRCYNPTYEKISSYQGELKNPQIQQILDSDIIWDEIISIEDIGVQPTWAIQTENETFLSDFVVNHNSTFLANNLVTLSVVQPYNKSLYVSPSHTQTRQFSSEKLKPAIEGSPLIRRYFQDSSVSQQVFEKGFTNGSYIFLRSAFRSADRTRGISVSGVLTLDEIQDMMTSEIPVIMECTSHYPNAFVLMAGTPKSFENPIEAYWQESSQNEWLVPCSGCRHWNFLDEQNIAPTQMYVEDKLPPGPVCKKCMTPLDVVKGQWMMLSPGKRIKGYRIPQLMVSWIIGNKDQWLKLLWKRDNYPLGQFYNEVLGLSYDNASKPITREELISCCESYNLWDPELKDPAVFQEAKKHILCGGVDWGEGNDGSEKSPSGKIRNASYTVLTIGAYINQKVFKVLFIKKYTGKETDPEYVVNDIARICTKLDVKLLGVDWGHGWGVNNHLIRKLSANKVVQFQYLPKMKERIKWDPIGFRYHLLRNMVISELFYEMKQQNLMFPRWIQFEPFAKDILSIYTEYVEFQRQIKYDHRPSDPDDCFHSLLYAKTASDIYLGKSRRALISQPG